MSIFEAHYYKKLIFQKLHALLTKLVVATALEIKILLWILNVFQSTK